MREITSRTHARERVGLAAIAALAVGFAGCSSSAETGPTPPPQLWSITGTVSGAVAQGVTVKVVGRAWTATTDASGRYTLAGIPSGSYTVAASLDGYAFTPPERSVSISANVAGQDFVARASIGISGVVTGDAGAGVTVTLRGPSPATTTTTAITDDDGRYAFDDLQDGLYLVTPSLAGGYSFAPANSLVTLSGASVAAPDFVADAAPRTISGRVTGAVTGGVTVTLSGGAGGVAVTDAAGNFTFGGLEHGSYTVTPSRTGYFFTPAEISVTVEDADATGQTFVAAATHRIAGLIGGDAAAGVTVALSGAAAGEVTTDVAGRYEFAGLADGSYVVTPALGGYTFSPGSTAVTLAGADRTATDFTAARIPTYSISGAISGPVVAGVTVRLSGDVTAVTTTDATGAFAFTGLSNGTYMVTPSLEDHVFDPASRSVHVSDASVTGQGFTGALSPTARSIAGTVSGDAVAGVTMTLSGVSPVTATVTTPTDAGGAYAFADLADGLYLVTPSLAGFTFVPANSLVTVSGASVVGPDFTAVAVPRSISGRVSGAPATGVTVTLSGAATATTTTNGTGDYTFTGLVNGDYTVAPSLAGYAFAPAERSVTLDHADATGQDFVATATHRIAGTVSGDVVAGVTVRLSGAGTGEATTDGTGHYEFAELPDGSYLVTPSADGFTFDPASRAVTLAGADEASTDFAAARVPTYSVTGAVSGAVTAGVTMTLSGAAEATTTTDGTGAYSFTGLPNGSYMVIPSMGVQAFDPASRAFRVNGADVGGQDFTAP
jgi:hypothetical protein